MNVSQVSQKYAKLYFVSIPLCWFSLKQAVLLAWGVGRIYLHCIYCVCLCLCLRHCLRVVIFFVIDFVFVFLLYLWVGSVGWISMYRVSIKPSLALNHPERNGTDEKKNVDNILFRNRNSFRWFSLILYEFYFSDLRGPQLEQKILKLIRLTNCFIYSICFIWDFPSRKVFHLFFSKHFSSYTFLLLFAPKYKIIALLKLFSSFSILLWDWQIKIPSLTVVVQYPASPV